MEYLNKKILKPGDLLVANINIYTKEGFDRRISKRNIILHLGEESFYKGFDKYLLGRPIQGIYDFIIKTPSVFENLLRGEKSIHVFVEIIDYQDQKTILLETQLLNLNRNFEQLNAEKNNLNELLANERIKVKNLILESNKKIDEINQNANVKINETINDANKKINDLIAESNSVQDELNKTIKERDNTIIKQENIISKLQGVVDNSTKENEKLTTEVSELTQNIEDIKQENIQLHSSVKQIESENKKLASELAKAQLTISKKEKEKESQEKTNEQPVQKVLVVPKEMKKEIETYALQKFFEEFISYYKFYKVSSTKAIIEAETSDNDHLKAYARGNKMIIFQFDELFKKYGLHELMPKVGEMFDPLYQKVNDQIVDDSKPEHTIINVQSPGYKLHDRVVAVALVDTSIKSSKNDIPVSTPETQETTNNQKKTVTKTVKKTAVKRTTKKQ